VSRSKAPVSFVAFDFEWKGEAGALPEPLCLTAIESATGRVHRLWQDELLSLRAPPFPIGPEVTCCAYSAASDLVCFKVLNWELPARVFCTYAEQRVRYNGVPSQFDNDLMGACARRGITYTATTEIKKKQRERARDPRPYDAAERKEMVDYCLADTRANLDLALSYEPDMWWQRSLWYGRYAKACAEIEFLGLPLDTEFLGLLQRNRVDARLILIEDLDRSFGCYDNGHLRNSRVWAFADRHDIPWPALPSGAPSLADDNLKILGVQYPIVEGFRQLRKTVGALRANNYAVGSDGRSHVSLHPFATKTGRNAQKASQTVFLGPAWMRGLMRAQPGNALIYLDYEGEEFAIAAALSEDPAMRAAYESGDPYMSTAVRMGLAPPGATRYSHPEIRAKCKIIVLGLGYGMTYWGLALRLGIGESEAVELVTRYNTAYPVFRRWLDGLVAHVKAHKQIMTPFGWPMYVRRSINPRTLLNWPMQALAADLLRLLAVTLVENKFRVLALVHDAVLLECAIADVDKVVREATRLMVQASETVIGIRLRVDDGDEQNPHVFCYPERFRDQREGDMYDRAQSLLLRVEQNRQITLLIDAA
jgi:hypothetical protein